MKFRYVAGISLGKFATQGKFSTDLNSPVARVRPNGKTCTMVTTAELSAPVPLFQARRQPDGAHSSRQLSRDVDRGDMLRIRHGVYVPAAAWTQAPPWHRHQMAMAATAVRDPRLIFCRESALILHGLPLRAVPPKVTVRTTDPGWAGTKPPPRMTGTLPSARRRQLLTAPEGESHIPTSVLTNVPTQHLEHALPAGTSRPELRRLITAGDYEVPRTTLPAEALSAASGAEQYLVEPLGLALVDTLSRMPFADAVVVLDAVLAHHRLDLGRWLPFLTSQRSLRRWDRAWDFADARSESPGESLSRALIAELGFPAPTLQRTVTTDAGTFRLDFCWEDQRIVGEFDGRMKYFDDELLAGQDPREVLYREKQREDALRRAGWLVVRWGWSQLRDPRELAHRLLQAGLLAAQG